MNQVAFGRAQIAFLIVVSAGFRRIARYADATDVATAVIVLAVSAVVTRHSSLSLGKRAKIGHVAPVPFCVIVPAVRTAHGWS